LVPMVSALHTKIKNMKIQNGDSWVMGIRN
jgi:hypothetical protein